MAKENVHAGHRKRMRERAAAEGLYSFDPHQVMELVLFYAVPRQDTSEMAHALIDRFGSVYGVLKAEPSELMRVEGVGRRVAEWLNMLGEQIDAYSALRSTDRPRIRNYRDVIRLCMDNRPLMERDRAYFFAMSPGGAIQMFSELSDSLSWGEPGVVRKFLHEVLMLYARNIIIIENTDDEYPVVDDYAVSCAATYGELLQAMGAELLDVFVVGRSQVISLYREGRYVKENYGAAKSLLSQNYLCEDDELDLYDPETPLLMENGL